MLLIDWPTEIFRNAEGEGVNHYGVTLRKALKPFRKEFSVNRNLRRVVRMNFGPYSFKKCFKHSSISLNQKKQLQRAITDSDTLKIKQWES